MKRRPGPRKAAVHFRVSWSDRAVRDLEAIGEFIAERNPEAAGVWVEKLLGVAENAATLPLAARVVPEVGRADIREVFLRTYRIVFRVLEGEIHILAVFEGHRLYPDDVDE